MRFDAAIVRSGQRDKVLDARLLRDELRVLPLDSRNLALDPLAHGFDLRGLLLKRLALLRQRRKLLAFGSLLEPLARLQGL